jgi:hypothetical protein
MNSRLPFCIHGNVAVGALLCYLLPHVIQQYQTTWLEVVVEARVVRARQAALADLHTRNAGFHATLAGDSQVLTIRLVSFHHHSRLLFFRGSCAILQ